MKRVFFDSNAILAIVGGGELAVWFESLASLPHQAVITDLVASECLVVALRRGWTDRLDALQYALADDFDRVTPEWSVWHPALLPIARRYASRIAIGTNDLLHLAAAQLAGCDGFASLDVKSGLRAVAHHAGLTVFPKLNSLPVKDGRFLTALR